MPPFQINFFGQGHNNNIINVTVGEALNNLLNQAHENLSQRNFACPEIKTVYTSLLTQMTQWIGTNDANLNTNSAFVLFPFKPLPNPNVVYSSEYIGALLETLTLIAFSDFESGFEDEHINMRINGNQTCGLYHHTSGANSLVDSFVQLVKSLKDKNVSLPNNMIFIILRCIGQDTKLDPDKIRNVLDGANIMGDEAYIKPLQLGSPRCINLTTYVIDQCTTLAEAKDFIRGVLSSD